MRGALAFWIVFLGGFALMVLEIVGARFLARDFGNSFYVWVSQIGVILLSLALGYFIGGALADCFERASILAWLCVPTGIFIWFIPVLSVPLLDRLVSRHPLEAPIPLFWQKLDPALGSALIFLLPGFVLATLSPFMIRLISRQLIHVGRVSGMIYAAGTLGSVAGVFLSGYVLIDYMKISSIFKATGVLTGFLGVLCLGLNRAEKSPSLDPNGRA